MPWDDDDPRGPVWFSATRCIGYRALSLVTLTVIRLAISTALLLLAAVFPAETQQLPKVPRIGVLGAQALGPGPDNAFRDGLRQFGYVDGKNIAIEWRGSQTGAERLPELAANLVQLKVEVIVATNNPAVAAAQKATTTIPIVMVLATDPVRLGFVTQPRAAVRQYHRSDHSDARDRRQTLGTPQGGRATSDACGRPLGLHRARTARAGKRHGSCGPAGWGYSFKRWRCETAARSAAHSRR